LLPAHLSTVDTVQFPESSDATDTSKAIVLIHIAVGVVFVSEGPDLDRPWLLPACGPVGAEDRPLEYAARIPDGFGNVFVPERS
jgi:hypothetical protein